MRHIVRPGVTGWAQVKYGYASDERDALEKLQYDFHYLRRQSVLFDLRIIVRTIRAVIGRMGGDGLPGWCQPSARRSRSATRSSARTIDESGARDRNRRSSGVTTAASAGGTTHRCRTSRVEVPIGGVERDRDVARGRAPQWGCRRTLRAGHPAPALTSCSTSSRGTTPSRTACRKAVIHSSPLGLSRTFHGCVGTTV